MIADNGRELPATDGATDNIPERFRQLHRLMLGEHATYAALYADYLQTGCRLLGMSLGIVSRIEQALYTVVAVYPGDRGVYSGDTFPLGETYCARVVDEDTTVAIENMGSHPDMRQHPAYQKQKLESYLAVPIRVRGQIYGTLNFTNQDPRDTGFSEADVELVDLMARSLGNTIERDELERQREEAVREMRENVDVFESAFQYAAIGIALVAPDGRWLRVNRSLTQMLGYSAEELMDIDFQTITHPDDIDKDLAYVREMLENKRETYRMEKRYFRRDGQLLWILLSVSLVRNVDGSPRYFVSQIQDITEQRVARDQLAQRQKELEAANRKLRVLATHDELTGLCNRRALTQYMQEEAHACTRTGLSLSLLILDIDHFKRYNDTFGHQAGDQALCAISRVLQEAGRVNDRAARFGGEEFVILLPHTDETGAYQVAERIRLAVAGLDELKSTVTCSIGCATWTPPRTHSSPPDIDELLHRADEALYRAKAEGRNRTCQYKQP